MTYSLTEVIALAALLLWPAIPLFWVPVHCRPRFFRRLGLLTYLLPLFTWLPLAVLTFMLRDVLLAPLVELPLIVNLFGALLFILGAALQVWTLILLTPRAIVGMPEVVGTVPGRLVASGPFSVIRHPTYLSHTAMLLGLFFCSEVTALGVVTILDALVAAFIIIPLEERELLERFGKEYAEYCGKVPAKFLPLRLMNRRRAL